MHLRCPSRIWIHSRLNTDSNFGFSRGRGTSARSPTVACTDLSQIIAESVDCGQAVWTGLPDDLAWSGLGYWPLDGDYEQFSWCWWGFLPYLTLACCLGHSHESQSQADQASRSSSVKAFEGHFGCAKCSTRSREPHLQSGTKACHLHMPRVTKLFVFAWYCITVYHRVSPYHCIMMWLKTQLAGEHAFHPTVPCCAELGYCNEGHLNGGTVPV